MVEQSVPLSSALQTFDRTTLLSRLQIAEQERVAMVKEFPLERWPTLTVEEYAIGQQESEDTFSRWIEFRTMATASMRGGQAHNRRAQNLGSLVLRVSRAKVSRADGH